MTPRWPVFSICFLFWAGTFLLLRGATPAMAQITPGTPYSSALQGFYQSWTLENGAETETITQIVTPIGVYLPLADGVEMRLATSYAQLERTHAMNTRTVRGLTDLKVQLNGTLFNRRLLLGAVINAPTGKQDLTSEDQDVLFSFISPDLSVRENRFGQGLNLGGTVSYAMELAPTSVLALGVGVVHRGAFDTPLLNQAEPIRLKPGFEATLTSAWDYIRPRARFRLSVAFTRYGTETVNGVDFFRLGPKVQAQASYTRTFAQDRGTLTLSIVELYRFSDTIIQDPDAGITQRFANGNYVVTLVALGYQLSRRIQATASGVGRFIGHNASGFENSTVFETGLTLTFITSRHLHLSLGQRFITGSGTNRDGATRNIQGLEGFARATLRF